MNMFKVLFSFLVVGSFASCAFGMQTNNKKRKLNETTLEMSDLQKEIGILEKKQKVVNNPRFVYLAKEINGYKSDNEEEFMLLKNNKFSIFGITDEQLKKAGTNRIALQELRNELLPLFEEANKIVKESN